MRAKIRARCKGDKVGRHDRPRHRSATMYSPAPYWAVLHESAHAEGGGGTMQDRMVIMPPSIKKTCAWPNSGWAVMEPRHHMECLALMIH